MVASWFLTGSESGSGSVGVSAVGVSRLLLVGASVVWLIVVGVLLFDNTMTSATIMMVAMLATMARI